MTNYHVIEGAERVQVRLNSGEALPARFVGAAPDYDLAVVRLSSVPAGVRPIPLGTSETLNVGQAVFAIGNPFGLSRTLTTGIVSAIDRHLPTAWGREVHGVIQTDAAINPGNSGGPLLDSAGRLIGVNTAIISGSGSSAGVRFAVPVDIANRIVPQLISDGKVPRAGIGVAIVPEETSARFGISGLVFAAITEGSPAADAGLRGIDTAAGQIPDVITDVDGVRVDTIAEFAALCGGSRYWKHGRADGRASRAQKHDLGHCHRHIVIVPARAGRATLRQRQDACSDWRPSCRIGSAYRCERVVAGART